MANRNIDESIRKPRRTKGTPFYRQRNYFAIGGIVFGGVCWALYELWPESQKLKKNIAEGKYKFSPELQDHIYSMQLGTKDPTLQGVISKMRERRMENDRLAEEQPRLQPWYSKVLSGGGSGGE